MDREAESSESRRRSCEQRWGRRDHRLSETDRSGELPINGSESTK